MATLRVSPSDLESYAVQLSRAADDARECKAYFTQQVPEMSTVLDGIINPFVYEHLRVQSRLEEILKHLVAVLDGSRSAMISAAELYRTTDADSAAHIDSTYPGVTRSMPSGSRDVR